MKRRFSVACGLVLAVLAGCVSSTPVTKAPPVDGPIRLGAGDSLGQDLMRTDRAIADAVSREPSLASHPD